MGARGRPLLWRRMVRASACEQRWFCVWFVFWHHNTMSHLALQNLLCSGASLVVTTITRRLVEGKGKTTAKQGEYHYHSSEARWKPLPQCWRLCFDVTHEWYGSHNVLTAWCPFPSFRSYVMMFPTDRKTGRYLRYQMTQSFPRL